MIGSFTTLNISLGYICSLMLVSQDMYLQIMFCQLAGTFCLLSQISSSLTFSLSSYSLLHNMLTEPVVTEVKINE